MREIGSRDVARSSSIGLLIVVLLGATAARWLLDPVFAEKFPFSTFVLAVAFMAWHGGFAPAIATMVLSLPIVRYLFLEPRYELSANTREATMSGSVYLLACLVIAGFAEAMRRAERRADAQAKEADARSRELEVQLALQRETQTELARRREWFRVAFSSIGDAVITTDAACIVKSVNPVATLLSGWSEQDATGRPLDAILKLLDEETRQPIESPGSRALRDRRIVGLENHTLLVARDGSERVIDDSAAPIVDEDGTVLGTVLVFRDVTERRQAELDRQYLAAIVESSDDAVIGKTVAGIITSWNRGAERLYGYSRDEIIGQHISVLVPPGRYDELQRIMDRVCHGERTDHVETVRRRKDGTLIDVSVTISPIRNRDGSIVGASAIGRDITERRRSQEALQQREEELTDFFENATIGLNWVSPDGAVLRSNQAQLGLIGYADDEYVGQQVARFHLDPTIAEHVLERLRAGLTVRDQPARLRCKDGSIKQVLIDASGMWQNGRLVHSRWFTRDVTALSRATNNLIDREERLRLALEAGRMGTWEWNIDTNEVQWSPSLEVIHGLGPGSFGGTYAAYQRDIHPEDRDRVAESLRRTLESGSDHQVEYRIVWPDGSVHWVEGRGKLFVDEPGGRRRLIGVCTDITERKRAEETLREADRRKTEFLAVLAHELRNPLAPLRSALQILERAHREDRDSQLRARQIMDRQLQQLVRLVDDLLDVSRISSGKIELRRERVPLDTIVRNALETCRPLLESSGHSVEVDLPSEPLFLRVDPTRLSQVIANLVNNACKYTDPGGRVRLDAAREDNWIVLNVTDTGVGIRPEALTRIFDMFAQDPQQSGRDQGGLGVGLSLVRALVELHGGSVAAYSDGPGRGSRFTVRLPVAVDEPVSISRPAPGPTDGSSRRFLVVDDNTDSADTLAMLLRLMGHEVRTAYDGASALDEAHRFSPDVVLLDIGMPGMNGYEVARRLRAELSTSGLLVAITGWGQDEDRRRSIEAGFDHHLTKPVDADALQAFVQSAGPAVIPPAPSEVDE